MRRFIFAALFAVLALSTANAGGWETVHRYVHPTHKCGAMREVMASHYCERGLMADGAHMRCGDLTMASWEYGMHSVHRLVNPANGRECKGVRVTDTGPNGIARKM